MFQQIPESAAKIVDEATAQAHHWYDRAWEVVGQYDEELITAGLTVFVVLAAMKFFEIKNVQVRRLLAWQGASVLFFVGQEVGMNKLGVQLVSHEDLASHVLGFVACELFMLVGVGVVGIGLRIIGIKFPKIAELL